MKRMKKMYDPNDAPVYIRDFHLTTCTLWSRVLEVLFWEEVATLVITAKYETHEEDV